MRWVVARLSETLPVLARSLSCNFHHASTREPQSATPDPNPHKEGDTIHKNTEPSFQKVGNDKPKSYECPLNHSEYHPCICLPCICDALCSSGLRLKRIEREFVIKDDVRKLLF